MTKAELIRKIAKRAGIPDSEAKIFFEIFLKKASQLLKPGDAVEVEGFGYFIVKRGKIKNKDAGEEDEKYTYSDLMTFSGEENNAPKDEEKIIFNIPVIKNEDYNLFDSYFSLSIGKPIIPLEGVKESEFFIPPTGNELKKLIESKVEKLLLETKIHEDYSDENEIMFVESETYNKNQIEFNWDESADKSLEEHEALSWDFGEDLSKQIEEESILDLGRDEDEIADFNIEGEKGELSWDFDKPEEADQNENEEENRPNNENEFVEESFDSPKEENQDELKDEAEPETEDFQRVKSITSEFGAGTSGLKLTESELNLSWDFDKTQEFEDSDFEEENDEPAEEEDFKEVTKNNKFPYETDEDIQLNEFLEEDFEPAEDEEFFNKAEETENEPIDVLDPIIHTEAKEPEGKNVYSKRGSTVTFVIAASVIIAVSAALFFFLKKNDFSAGTKVEEAGVNRIASVIERNYDVPVSYPYDTNTLSSITLNDGIDENAVKVREEPVPAKTVKNESVQKESVKTTAEQKTQVSKQAQIKEPNDLYASPENQEKVQSFIFKTGDKYLAQVSSWPSRKAAEREAKKFQDKGFTTYIERAMVSGGVWYRIKVGLFNTLDEAVDFQKKNQ